MPLPPRMLTYGGETMTLAELAAKHGIEAETLRARIDRLGWDLDRALTTPIDRRFRKGGRPRRGAVRSAPKLRHHKASDRAFARWRAGDRDMTRYFGPWGSAEAREEYRRFSLEWAAHGTPAPETGGALLVAELVERRLLWAEREYRKAGRLTSEYSCQVSALGVFLEVYGPTLVAEFDPVRFRAMREAMVGRGWARRTVNHHAARVVAAVGWAAGQGWVPAAVPAALREVGGLKAGKTAAPDHAKRRAVSDADVEAVIPHLSPIPKRAAWLAAMVRVQRLTGMRPGEICGLRPCDLDRTNDVWVYTVAPHINKNAHRDRPQVYFIGPRSQRELAPYLDGPPDKPAFKMTVNGYGIAVRRACRAAKIETWHPHLLRHSLATEVAKEAGSLGAAAAAIGDTPQTTRKHYLHCDPEERAKIEWARDRG